MAKKKAPRRRGGTTSNAPRGKTKTPTKGAKAKSRRAPAKSGGAPFNYRKRSAADVRQRGEQQGGGFDSMFNDKLPKYKVKKDNRLRILPPTFDNAEHYGIEVYVNYNIGPDGERYLSLSKMKNAPDPIAEELARAQREGEDEDYIRDLKPKKRVLVYVIDRDDESAGPMLWDMPWTVDRDVALQCVDKRTNEVTYIDHPDEGYDIEFTKTGAKKQTEYHGFKVARNSSPISDDPEQQAEWLEFITENPLPEQLRFFDYDHIKAKLEAAAPADSDDEDDDDQPKTRRGKGRSKIKADPEPEDDPEDDEWEDEEDEDLDEEDEEDEDLDEEDEEDEDLDEDDDEDEDLDEDDDEDDDEWVEDDEEDEAYIPAKGDRVEVDYDGEMFPGTVASVSKARQTAWIDFDDESSATHAWDELTPLDE